MISRREFSVVVGALLLPPSGMVSAMAPPLKDFGLDFGLGTTPPQVKPEHWRVATDEVWQWFERQTLTRGEWKVTGITTPVDIATGERYTDLTGYLPEELVPEQLRYGGLIAPDEIEAIAAEFADPGVIDDSRKARHGRPPSPWLRSQPAAELRIWLASLEPPQAGVSGMTFWQHLTRDHGFQPELIEGLTEAEQAKLHGAAHAGY